MPTTVTLNDVYASSDFSTNADGWQIQFGYPSQAAHDPYWQEDWIIWSTAIDPAITHDVFFMAPTTYTGDLSGCYGQNLDFSILLELPLGSKPNSFYTGLQGVIIKGVSADLWIPAGVQDLFEEPVSAPTQLISVLLKETEDCRLSTTGTAPTTGEFQAVLASVNGILLRADWYPDFDVFKSGLGSVTLYKLVSGGGLDPILQALQTRLTGAITGDSLTLDQTTLGTDGAAIVQLMQDELGVASIEISGNVTVTAADAYLKVTADTIETETAGISQTGVNCWFGVDAGVLTVQMQVAGGTDWSMATSFPNLSMTWVNNVTFVTDEETDTLLILSSADGPLLGSATGATVPQGLGMQALLGIADGPAKTLIEVVTGVSANVPAIGPCTISDKVEAFTLYGDLPDFSFSLPVLPTLDFTKVQLGVSGYLDGTQMQPSFDAFFEAAADISFGNAALPLMLRVPGMGQGWILGLRSGRSVSIADLGGFFSSFTGLSFAGQLPDAITSLTKFELQTFYVQLTADHNDYRRLGLTFGTPTNWAAENAWTIIPGTETPILSLTGLSFELQVDKIASTTTYRGAITGSFDFSDTLQIQASVGLPYTNSLITVSCSSYAALPNLTDFARFLGGQSLASLVPNGLGALTSYNLQDFHAVYSPSQTKLLNVGIGLVSSDKWTIVPDQLVIDSLLMKFDVNDPLSGNSVVTGRVAGMISLGQTTKLEVSVYKAFATDSWHFSVFTDYVPLPSLGDIASLAGGNIESLLPDNLKDNSFSLSNITILADISNTKMEKLGFTLSTTDTWPIITDILEVTEAGVTLGLDWTGPAGTRAVTGVIWGNVTFCKADFWLQASYASDNWNLSVELMPDSSLELKNLVDAFDTSLWTGLTALGVPNVTLKSASTTYATSTGSYSISGEIGPSDDSKWIIPIGITNIEILSIGAEVSCTRDSDGKASDKKVYVNGAFNVGSVHFTTSYLAGDNLTINAELVGSEPVSVSEIVSNICSAGAGTVSWTSGFETLDAIKISNLTASLVLGDKPSFQIVGSVEIDSVDVDCFFLIKKVNTDWEFALAIKVDTNWSLSGFTNAYAPFNIDKETWMLAASSFTETGFKFPPSFQTPYIGIIDRGLDFYGSFEITNTLSTISTLEKALPSDTLPSTITVHGLLADPLSDSFLEVIISASEDGIPLLGMDEVRIAAFSLRLMATPAFALHGDFIFKAIKNPDGSFFHLIVDLTVSATEIRIDFEQQPDQGAIFTWQDAFGITSLDVSLLDLGIGITDDPLAIDGSFGGQVTFDQSEKSVMKNAAPNPLSVIYLNAQREILKTTNPEKHALIAHIDYSQSYDQDPMVFMLDTSILVVISDPPIPYPYKLKGILNGLTLPNLLDRFADIDLPDILSPIQFPHIDFDIQLPDPSKPGTDTNLHFNFDGKIIIFGLHGEVQAKFDATHVFFSASMDAINIAIGGFTLVAISAEDDHSKGPSLTIDSAGTPNIAGTFYCNFFEELSASGDIELINATDPLTAKFKFHIEGHAGSLANMSITIIYHDLDYLMVDGSFDLDLTTGQIPGFSSGDVVITSGIDLSKANKGEGIAISAFLDMTLDATQPTNPDFKMDVGGSFHLGVSESCQFDLTLPKFSMDVNKDSIASIPAQVVIQMGKESAAIFGAILSAAPGCFIELLKLGIFVLESTAMVAAVLHTIFNTGIDLGSAFLKDVGGLVDDVSDAIWSIFGSHSSKDNTKALKDAGYHAAPVADAIKKTVDKEQPHDPYKPSQLVHDQAQAGYLAPHVAGGLCSAFSQYTSQPVGAGQLLANQELTSFTSSNVAAALKSQYGSSTTKASDMVTLLNQIYTGSSSLTPQALADALAPLYSAAEVAQALRTQFPNDTKTASAISVYLVTAYGSALTVSDLAAALAPLYSANEVAPVLHTDFPADTDTAFKLGSVLKAAYSTTSTPLDVTAGAIAIATVYTTPSEITMALIDLYADDTDTAAKMAPILMAAYPSMTVADMAAGLAAGEYPLGAIAAELKKYFGTDAGTPAQMTSLLAAQNYTPAQVAPVLVILWPDECGTASAVAGFLIGGFAAGSINVAAMALALKTAPFSVTEIAPALKTNYTSDTVTASAMATILITAFKDGTGANTIPVTDMAKALKAAPYNASGDDGAAVALIANYASDTATAIDMSKLLAGATYTVVEVGPALTGSYASTVNSASTLATVFAATPFGVVESAPVIKTLFADGVPDASTMYSVLNSAWSDPVLTVADMASALAGSPYDIISVAPVLKTNYSADIATATDMYNLLVVAYTSPAVQDMTSALAAAPYSATDVAPVIRSQYASDAGTVALLAPLLKAAYSSPAIDLDGMLKALVAASFNAYEMAPTVHTLYSTAATAQAMGTGLVTSLAGTAPLSALPLGVALMASSFNSANIGQGVKAGLGDTSAGLMAAMLMIVSDDTLSGALTSAAGFKAAGDTMTAAAPKIIQAVAGVDGKLLSATLGSVFTPPNTTVTDLITATVAAYTTPVADDIAAGALTFFSATTASDLLVDLTAAYTAGGKTIDPASAAVAVKTAFDYIGSPINQADFAKLIIDSEGSAATPDIVASAIVQAYGNSVTPDTLIPALVTAFAGTQTLLDARVAAVAVTAALSLSPTDADKIVTPLASTFGLTRCPNDVGALAVALKSANYSVNATSAALSAYFGDKWTPAAFQIVSSVYTKSDWTVAVDQRVAGAAITAASVAVYTANTACDAALMVQVLAAAYDLTQTDAAIEPMADALKAVTSGGIKVYSLNAASAAMSAQYSPDWSAANWQAFITYYNS